VRRLFPAVLFLATLVTLAFLVVPILAIFLRVSPGDLVSALGSAVARDALIVTLETTVIAQLLIVCFGTPTAYLLATRRFPGRSLAVTLVELPLVLPPAVAGIGLLATFGRLGLLGSSLSALGIEIAFTKIAGNFRIGVMSPSCGGERLLTANQVFAPVRAFVRMPRFAAIPA